MAKIKEASSFNGTSWGTAIPIGVDDSNFDVTSSTQNPSTDTGTSLDSSDVIVAVGDTGATAWTKFNRFRKRVKNALADLSVIAIGPDTPTRGEKLWLDTSGSGLVIPQINDNTTSLTDTWSSNKIKSIGIAVQDSEPVEDVKAWIDTDDTESITVPDMDDYNSLVIRAARKSIAAAGNSSGEEVACTGLTADYEVVNVTLDNGASGASRVYYSENNPPADIYIEAREGKYFIKAGASTSGFYITITFALLTTDYFV